jgi:hypothetical protein
VYNKNICGTDWTTVRTPETWLHVYNGDFGNKTCLSAKQYQPDFQVTQDISGSNRWPRAYPDISAGWDWGRYTCTGHTGPCFTFPVQERRDGHPFTSLSAWLAPGKYNLAYDIWFNKTDAHPNQDDGVEIMIWLAHPGLSNRREWTVVIDGIRWDVMHWHASNYGKTWNYVAYVARRPRSSVPGLWLNKFFRDAIAHRELSPYWWLTAIDAGFELVHGGVHDNIHRYTLTGLPSVLVGAVRKARP